MENGPETARFEIGNPKKTKNGLKLDPSDPPAPGSENDGFKRSKISVKSVSSKTIIVRHENVDSIQSEMTN